MLVDKPDHPVRRRGGGRLGRRQHHPRHRPRQERDRGPLRRLVRTRDVPRGRGARPELLAEIRKISNLVNFAYVRQGEPLGLGHAVLVTRDLVGQEPFAVILGDDVIDAEPPALRQMVDVFERVQGPVLAVERVPEAQVSSYGIVEIAESMGDGVYRVKDLVEKPRREDAPSNLAIIGRYILTPDIFPALEATQGRSHRRDPADQRPAPPAAGPADLRVRGEGRPPRHRQQARVPEGGRLLRAAAAGPGRGVQGVPAGESCG